MDISQEVAAREDGGHPPGWPRPDIALAERLRHIGADLNDATRRHLIVRGSEVPRIYIECDETRRGILLGAEQTCREAGYEFLHPIIGRDYRLPPQPSLPPRGTPASVPEALKVLIDHGYEVRRA